MAQPIRTAPSQEYGQRVAQEEAQRAIPLPSATPLVPLDAPSLRENEPVTAGLTQGPGPGPEVLQFGQQSQMSLLDELKALYQARPSRALLRLIYEAEEEPGDSPAL